MDASEVGRVAALVMEDLESDHGTDDSARVVAAMVVYEVTSVADGERRSTVGARVTEDRNVVGLGLVERIRDAMLTDDPDER